MTIFSLAASLADVEEAGYSPPTPFRDSVGNGLAYWKRNMTDNTGDAAGKGQEPEKASSGASGTVCCGSKGGANDDEEGCCY